MKWLRSTAAQRPGKPWALYVGFVCPHFPLIAPPQFYSLYPEAGVPWPDMYDATARPRHPFLDAMRKCLCFDEPFDPPMVRRAIAAGVDGLVHAAYVDDSLATQMRDREMWLIPTLASLTRGDSSPAALALVQAVGRLHRRGVTLVYGTDGGVLPHGQNAEEALALQAAGVPAVSILRAATANAAKALGLSSSVGAIRPGMVADLVAVQGDPLSDLSLLQRPSFVMARGRVVIGAAR